MSRTEDRSFSTMTDRDWASASRNYTVDSIARTMGWSYEAVKYRFKKFGGDK